MPVREVEVDRIRLDDAETAGLGKLDEAADRARVEAGGGDEDERLLGAGQDAGGLVDLRGIGKPVGARETARR